tara:strand:+ start:210 stop:518 length:309 start_codon:yes stop_codon:yes gene_type:complete
MRLEDPDIANMKLGRLPSPTGLDVTVVGCGLVTDLPGFYWPNKPFCKPENHINYQLEPQTISPPTAIVKTPHIGGTMKNAPIPTAIKPTPNNGIINLFLSIY